MIWLVRHTYILSIIRIANFDSQMLHTMDYIELYTVDTKAKCRHP
jgi:hypothetical protein